MYFKRSHRSRELDNKELLCINTTTDIQGRGAKRGLTHKGISYAELLDTRGHGHNISKVDMGETLVFKGLYGIQEMDNKERIINNNTYDT